MIDPVSLSIIRDIVAIFGVIAGFTYYVINVQNSKRMQKMQLETRQAQLFMQIYDHYNDKEFAKMVQESLNIWKWEDIDDGWEKYGLEMNIEATSQWFSVFNYFKGVGVLVKRNLLEISVVYDLLSVFLIPLWEKWEPMIVRYRERYNSPTAWESAEYLYNELIKYIKIRPELKT